MASSKRRSASARSTAVASSTFQANGRGNDVTKTPAGSGWYPARTPTFDVVIAIVRYVRPWKPPCTTITLGRPVAWRASFTAASVASAPELEKKKVSIRDGVICARRAAKLLGQRTAVAVGLRVDELGRLLADRVDDARMAVPGARDRDAGGEVEVLLAVGGRDHAARAGDDLEIRGAEPHVTQMRTHAVPLIVAVPGIVVSPLDDHAARVRAAPDGVGQPDPRAGNLARSGVAAQLMHQLDDLSERRRAQRLALREQAAAGVHREGAAQQGRAVGEQLRLVARFAEAELLIREELAGGVGVLALDHVDVAGPDARLLVRVAPRASTAA